MTTPAAVQQRGTVRCAVDAALAGFSRPDASGHAMGLSADFCRAVAAAVLGDAAKVTFRAAATPEEAFTLAERGEVDIAIRSNTITYSRSTGRNLSPAGVLYYDGQGFLARRESHVTSARQLEGKVVCAAGGGGVQADTVLRAWATAHGINVAVVTLPNSAEVAAALRDNRCDVATADRSALAGRRLTDFPDPQAMVLLPEIISREPLGAFVQAGAEDWRDIVAWTLNALVAAEEMGVGSKGTALQASPANPEVALLTGQNRDGGKGLGLPADWAARMIRQVGNYGELYDRNLGEASPIKLDRGLNDLWLRGGLMYPWPMR